MAPPVPQCHKAKNFVPGKEASSTKVSMAVMELQERLPRARVVYCSATGVSEVGNMVRDSVQFECSPEPR
jgi:P-loop containing NTP hydrolase pore-1